MNKFLMGMITACIILGTIIVTNREQMEVTNRYEFFCDRVEYNSSTDKSYAVIEIYDTHTGEISMVDVAINQ